jgi:4-hydroxy-2-oxoheptanedioate aldolase
VLDAGARGVIVPMVETAADAEAAARACRYPPNGSRSWGQMVGNWGRPEVDPNTSNANVICAVMVENDTGLANVDAIAATEGVDMIYVGPFDLSIALGTTVDDLLSVGRGGPIGKILDACERHGVVPGAFAGTEVRARRLAELGFVVLAVGTDAGLLKDASNAAKAKMQGGVAAGEAAGGRAY